jgi:transposase, IS5 family
MSRTLFGEESRLDRLKTLNDPLVEIKEKTDWIVFKKTLDKVFPVKSNEQGGRPAYSKLLLFKILILQEYYGLSDKGVEYQITDRLSFMRFLDLTVRWSGLVGQDPIVKYRS